MVPKGTVENKRPFFKVLIIWLESIQLIKNKNKIIRPESSTAGDEEKITRARMEKFCVCVFFKALLGIYPERKEWIQIKEKSRGRERSSEGAS